MSSDIQIFNTLTHQKASFAPLKPKTVGIYVCGMTVYDDCHMGHARLYTCIDTIVRFFQYLDFDVRYVRNITDVDDKIIKRALDEKVPFNEITERYITSMHEDFKALGMVTPDIEPRATEHMSQIIALIEELLRKEKAYVAENGDVYFDVSAYPNYGELSRKDISGQDAGHRVEVATVKRHPQDFVLWKLAKPDEPKWHSPWGEGRPGWHIECSAMSMHHLGETFDIHAGGADLQFPHHENELAQSKACGHEFVRFWMHIGYLQVNREKMSKSLGNFFTIKKALTRYHPMVIRYFLVASHYRSQLNFSEDNLDAARGSIERLYQALRGMSLVNAAKDTDYEKRFKQSMMDDFNTPEAIAVLFEIAKFVQKCKSQQQNNRAEQHAALLYQLGQILGIFSQEVQSFFQAGIHTLSNQEIETMIEARQEARAQKDWQQADVIRDKLLENGIELEDGAKGTTWRKKH